MPGPSAQHLTGNGKEAVDIILKDFGVEGLEHKRIKTELPSLFHHFQAHFAGDKNIFGGGKEGPQLVEQLDPILAGKPVIENENAHTAKTVGSGEGLLGAAKGLDLVLVA